MEKKRDLDPKFNELIHFEEIMITKSVVGNRSIKYTKTKIVKQSVFMYDKVNHENVQSFWKKKRLGSKI